MHHYSTLINDMLVWRYHQLSAKLQEKSRLLKSSLNSPQLAIVGSFHGLNTGDNTLGLTIQNLVHAQNISTGLQNFHDINKWPQCPLTICAGGGTGIEKNLLALQKRNNDRVNKTAMVGMEFSSSISTFPSNLLDFLSNIRYISCRSKKQASALDSILGSQNVHYQPDNAFAYGFPLYPRKIIDSSSPKLLGFNSLNLFMTWVKHKGFVPGTPLEEWYRKSGNKMTELVSVLGPKYIDYLRSVIEHYYLRGWQINHIPFTPEDTVFAKSFLDKKMINFLKFTPSPNLLFSHIRECTLFISTRFHSLIFALIAGVPCIPIAYAAKCTNLIEDLGLTTDEIIERLELLGSLETLLEKTLYPQPLLLSIDRIEELANQAKSGIEVALNSILHA